MSPHQRWTAAALSACLAMAMCSSAAGARGLTTVTVPPIVLPATFDVKLNNTLLSSFGDLANSTAILAASKCAGAGRRPTKCPHWIHEGLFQKSHACWHPPSPSLLRPHRVCCCGISSLRPSRPTCRKKPAALYEWSLASAPLLKLCQSYKSKASVDISLTFGKVAGTSSAQVRGGNARDHQQEPVAARRIHLGLWQLHCFGSLPLSTARSAWIVAGRGRKCWVLGIRHS